MSGKRAWFVRRPGFRPLLSRCFVPGIVLAAAALAWPPDVAADDACDAWQVEYALAAKLQLSDTTMGAGDGVHTIGPGTATVRFENEGGRPGGIARLVAYTMKDNFTVVAKVLGLGTRVTNDTHTTVTPDKCGVAAQGALSGTTLVWTSPVAGMHTDGAVTCEGALCGKFGAPPRGTSPVHAPAHDVRFMPFEFDREMKTFTMQPAVVSKMTSPRQTSRVALSGREIKRTCVAAKVCP
jgi:hypothetical protein